MANVPIDRPIELQKTGKRDVLVDLEKKAQARWSAEKVFEVDAPPADPNLSPAELRAQIPKWLGTFPYPYMNGSLHLGHGFTISKIEFATGYQRMLGKRALFPVGFHCTGMPIKAAADKLVREMELFGPDFLGYVEETEEETAPAASTVAVPGRDDKAKKGKLVAKSTGLKYQFQIMLSINVPREEIKKFADPKHWLTYFPPITINDLTDFGARVDWRRSFITTDVNPYYDSFVRWQMNKLRALDKIKFGERYTIYSPKDGQPCMDHDRSSGEGVGPQEYTGLKMEVKEWSKAAAADTALQAKLKGKRVFFIAATLRSETTYAQTNCFVGSALKYGLFTANETDVYLCTSRAARNMAFQGITQPRGEVNQLAEIEGSKLIGTRVTAPNSLAPEVYVLPMENVLATKGTGVVTSCPSDSPDDFQAVADLRKKPEYYGVDPAWIPAEPINVISTPTYGEAIAPALIKQLKIQSQKDTKQLAEAKEIAYKEGFYSGVMSVGEFKGMAVQDAKPLVRAKIIKEGLAFAYAEPEGAVESRSGDECIVALVDQWYLDYGEETWKTQAFKLLGKMETYSNDTKHGFEGTLDWLNQWACARSFGLGSRVPWDKDFLVESLSDSTIYMSYYTVAHLLQGSWDGSKPGPLGIKAEQLTDEIWEYVLGSGSFPSSSPSVTKAQADALKHEFTYFYPLDIRSSGKDLIPNHLTFCIYNHAALFPEEYWPQSMRANGHLMLNGKKMSKSTGNSLTLRQSIDKFGADATRVALADGGDGIEDANFDELNANAAILRLHTLVEWCQEMKAEIDDPKSSLRRGPKNSYHDAVFENEIYHFNQTTKAAYEATNYKDALKEAFFEMQSARDWYREVTSDQGMHADLIKLWIRTLTLLVLPVAPHFSEHVWSTVLGEPRSVQHALWPEVPEGGADAAVLAAGTYMRTTLKAIRDGEITLVKRAAKGGKGGPKGGPAPTPFDPKKPKALRVVLADGFPEWQNVVLQVAKDAYDDKTESVDDVKVREALTAKGMLKDKRVMPYVQGVKRRIAQFGATVAFNRALPFNEREALEALIPHMKRSLNCGDAEIVGQEEARGFVAVDAAGFKGAGVAVEQAEPGSPGHVLWNV